VVIFSLFESFLTGLAYFSAESEFVIYLKKVSHQPSEIYIFSLTKIFTASNPNSESWMGIED